MFLMENDLADIASMKTVVAQICRQTQECSYFLCDYSKTKNFCESTRDTWSSSSSHLPCFAGIRLGKNVLSQTDDTITTYNAVFDDLMEQFRNRAARDTVVVVHRVLEGVQELSEWFMLQTLDYF